VPLFTAAVHEMTMLSKGQVVLVDVGRQVEAPCEYHATEFSMFENPVIWKKIQADEETAINIMGNILDPFLATGRFEVIFDNDQAPRYQMTLRISGQLSDIESLQLGLANLVYSIAILYTTVSSTTL